MTELHLIWSSTKLTSRWAIKLIEVFTSNLLGCFDEQG